MVVVEKAGLDLQNTVVELKVRNACHLGYIELSKVQSFGKSRKLYVD